jgi:hypothetical protein
LANGGGVEIRSVDRLLGTGLQYVSWRERTLSPVASPHGSYRIIAMVMLSLLLGPVGTCSSARSLVFNCIVASTICFVIYYVTSANMNGIASGVLLLRGGNSLGGEQLDMNSLEIDEYRTTNNYAEAFPEIVWIMSFGGSVRVALDFLRSSK